MKSKTPHLAAGRAARRCSARFPFRIVGERVYDATGSIVLVCDEDTHCGGVWAEREVNKDPHFTCPNCGRLGQRMEELKPTWGPYYLHPNGWYMLYPPNPAVRGRESASVPCTGVVR
jgi:predicted RNA-binding Zn-ribbon protein involved in translation (DUF1610 family)